jgi:hypothetical protein
MTNIPGYTYGSAAPSPVTLKELNELKQAVLFTAEDEKISQDGRRSPQRPD